MMKTIRRFISNSMIMVILALSSSTGLIYAATSPNTTSSTTTTATSKTTACDPQTSGTCPSCTGSDLCKSVADPASTGCTQNSCNLVKAYLTPAINLLSVLLALIAVISLIMAGIQYTASAGDPQKVSAAKARIRNTIIAIVAYIFLYAFIQFIIPGGFLNSGG